MRIGMPSRAIPIDEAACALCQDAAVLVVQQIEPFRISDVGCVLTRRRDAGTAVLTWQSCDGELGLSRLAPGNMIETSGPERTVRGLKRHLPGIRG